MKTSSTSLAELTPMTYNITEDVTELSVYDRGLPASPETNAKTIKLLSVTFPDMSKDFFDMLGKLIARSGMTEERLGRSVQNLLYNYHYPTFRPADLLGYGPKIKLYDGDDIYKMYNEYPYDGYCIVEILTPNGTIEKHCKTDDAKMYGLTIKSELKRL